MKALLKIIAVILAIASVLLLSYFSFKAGWEARENSDKYESFAVKTFYSYEDAMTVCDTVGIHKTYTIDYKGDDFTVFYQFVKDHCTTEYPIDYDTFIDKMGDSGLRSLTTYIFFDKSACPQHSEPDHSYVSGIYSYKGDEDYDKLTEYKVYPWATIYANMVDFVEIEDKALLTYEKRTVDIYNEFDTDVYYNGKRIFYIKSCFELDEALMQTIFEHLVVVK